MLQVAFDAAAEAMLLIDRGRRIHWANLSAAEMLVGGVPIQLMNQSLDGFVVFLEPGGGRLAKDHPLHPNSSLPAAMGDERLDLLLPEGRHLETRQVRWTPVATVQSPHLLLTIRDLTPEQRALQQQKNFMTELTHELRTPLTIVSGSLLRLQRESDLTVRDQRHVTRAAEEATRIHRLLEHLSLMVRLEVDPAWLGLRDQALLPVVEAWGQSCPDDISKRLKIETQVTGSDQVRMDANALVVVLDQLLENALTHGSETRDVTLQVSCPDGSDHCSLALSSLNRHPAVDESTINSWLKPFVRGGIQRDGVQVEGPGLGLALVRQLVEAWGGVLALHQEDDPQTTGWTLTQVVVTVPLSDSSELEGSREVGEKDRV